MNFNFNGKNILFIGIGFYDYDSCLANFFRNRGAKVFYFSSANRTLLERICLRVKLKNVAQKLFSNNILKSIKKMPREIDLIFLIKGENFGIEHIRALNQKYPDQTKILYLWDSLNRLPNKKLLLDNFPKIFTFDRIDALQYNLKFRPLFYRETKQRNCKIKYDISFVGYMHSTRYEILHLLKKQFEANNIKYKFILTLGKFSKWYLMNIKRVIAKEDADFIYTSRLSYDEYLKIVNESNVILDISHPMQSGLTMRTIEILSIGKRLLTTNRDISHYSFNEDQYRILELDNVDFDFLKDKSRVESDMTNYSMHNFVNDIFD